MSGTLVIPSAKRLMRSLRDIGYDLPGAVADLVDNSIDAGALRLAVDLGIDWRGAFIRIVDDGRGMTERELDEAMRYGSSRAYGRDDLGQYGLGLKTASLSQCRRLTVATRSTSRGRIRLRRWDLDHINEVDEWILERPRQLDCSPQVTDPLRTGTGTVVLWEKLDRVIGDRRESGDAAARRMAAAALEIRDHLGMVFHRFLSAESRTSRIKLTVNGVAVEPWDPFARAEPMTQALAVQKVKFDHAGRSVAVRVRPFVLPSQHQFSSPDAHVRAAGPSRWNRQQGLYIYRRDRLIQSGGWNRLRTMDEHSKLARVALDLPESEGVFRVNIAKMSVGIPDGLRPQLRVLIAGVVAHAQDAYRQRVRLVSDQTLGAPDRSGADAASFMLGDHWPLVVDVLEREMADHPELLDRVMVALVNARTPNPARRDSDPGEGVSQKAGVAIGDGAPVSVAGPRRDL